MHNSKRLTTTLFFSTFVVTLGTWYTAGYFNVALNVPQAYVVSWIRRVECSRYEDHENHTENFILWCGPLTEEEESLVLRDNFKLNTIWSVINSIVAAGILASVFSCRLFIRRFGLKGTIYIAAAIHLTGTLLSTLVSAVHFYELLIVGRLLCGFSEGLTGVTTVMYISEITPAKLRGLFGTVPMVMMVLGFLTANGLGLPMLLGTKERWTILLSLQCIPVILMCVSLPFCPDSPRQLFLVKGDKVGAEKALIWLRKTADVREEMAAMQRELDMQEKGKINPQVSLFGIFRDPYLRYIFGLCAAPMFVKQFSGYACVLYYSTSIFRKAGLDHLYSAYASLAMWLVYLTFSLISMSLVDRLGRRVMLLISHSGMMLGMALFTVFMVLSGSYAIDWAKYGGVASIFVWIAFYTTGSSSVAWFLPSEMFPQEARTSAMTWISAFCEVCGLTTSFLFPMVVLALEEYTFLIFVGGIALGTVYIVWKLPETKGMTIDEIQVLLRYRFNVFGDLGDLGDPKA
ncbi:Solute carrier family 2, facilitated glucose transporter member 3 [Hypsibius exemplaris]|uniref:Solute carrier family 2, facilitated glucose transporter member 3 n=1 Tax=Hypsibius exemplaris TaxID=2072580 RepID=A0A1W0WKV2_HYPEX|nr:Solute carrier family 2, facilitated glucose transporter member 3 [Hypsibius exemplaris]